MLLDICTYVPGHTVNNSKHVTLISFSDEFIFLFIYVLYLVILTLCTYIYCTHSDERVSYYVTFINLLFVVYLVIGLLSWIALIIEFIIANNDYSFLFIWKRRTWTHNENIKAATYRSWSNIGNSFLLSKWWNRPLLLNSGDNFLVPKYETKYLQFMTIDLPIENMTRFINFSMEKINLSFHLGLAEMPKGYDLTNLLEID